MRALPRNDERTEVLKRIVKLSLGRAYLGPLMWSYLAFATRAFELKGGPY